MTDVHSNYGGTVVDCLGTAAVEGIMQSSGGGMSNEKRFDLAIRKGHAGKRPNTPILIVRPSERNPQQSAVQPRSETHQKPKVDGQHAISVRHSMKEKLCFGQLWCMTCMLDVWLKAAVKPWHKLALSI